MLRVNDIYATIQGEGCNAGIPMILVRLQGCSAGCPWCDTKGAAGFSGGTWMEAYQILETVQNYSRGHQWVLLTGGEPLEQHGGDLDHLIGTLQHYGYLVALETNGGRWPLVTRPDWVTVSPKPQVPLNSKAIAHASEFKIVVGSEDDLPDLSIIPPTATICLQPRSLDPEATELCVKMVQERGWRLSLQLHKYIKVP